MPDMSPPGGGVLTPPSPLGVPLTVARFHLFASLLPIAPHRHEPPGATLCLWSSEESRVHTSALSGLGTEQQLQASTQRASGGPGALQERRGSCSVRCSLGHSWPTPLLDGRPPPSAFGPAQSPGSPPGSDTHTSTPERSQPLSSQAGLPLSSAVLYLGTGTKGVTQGTPGSPEPRWCRATLFPR